MKTVINISADKIAFFRAGQVEYLERNGVDLEIGKKLVALDRFEPLRECLVINGPGGFTNLRVGSLALNLLKALKGDQLSFFSLSKIELYQIAYQHGFLPRYGLIYIGQKSNVWLWDFEQQEIVKMVKKTDLSGIISEFGAVFCDEVYEGEYFDGGDQLAVFFDEEGVVLQYGGQDMRIERASLLIHPVDKLEPNYMIAPNVN